MQQRNPQAGKIKIQTLASLFVLALVGLVALPIWVSQANAPRETVLKANTRAVATTYASAIIDSATPSPLTTPGPQTAAIVRRLFQRPVVNPVTHSAAVVSGDDWRTQGDAPAIWITSRPDAGPQGIAHDTSLRDLLQGVIIVHIVAGAGIDVFAVPSPGDRVNVLQHLAAV